MRTHSFVPSYIFEGSHAPLYLSTPCRLHSSLKQCTLLLGRCFLVLLLYDRLRLPLLLVVLFRMSLSIKQNSMIAHIVCAPLFVENYHTALHSSASCRSLTPRVAFLCCSAVAFCRRCCFAPSRCLLTDSPRVSTFRRRRALYASCRKLQSQVCDHGDRRLQTCCSPCVAANDDVREMLQARGRLFRRQHTTPTTTPHR